MDIKISSVYTRTGDKGETSLLGGERMAKDHQKFEALGAVDELNSFAGTARTIFAEYPGKLTDRDKNFLERLLRKIQNELFDICSILATPEGKQYAGRPEISESQIAAIEESIDTCQKELAPLKNFILPGGTMGNAALHQCRSICRRAERNIIRLSRKEKIDPEIIKYLNRLSDLFFVLARYVNKKMREKEDIWDQSQNSQK